MRPRVFVSFTPALDVEMRNELYRLSLLQDSPFTVSGWSRRPLPGESDWEARTRDEIGHADVVVALASAATRVVGIVRDEVAIARDLAIPVIGVKADAYPSPPDNLDELLDWEWEAIKEAVRRCTKDVQSESLPAPGADDGTARATDGDERT